MMLEHIFMILLSRLCFFNDADSKRSYPAAFVGFSGLEWWFM